MNAFVRLGFDDVRERARIAERTLICAWAERIERAEAIIVGETNARSWASAARGQPAVRPEWNPFDVTRNTGGSSGVSAAAAAAGMLTAAEDWRRWVDPHPAVVRACTGSSSRSGGCRT